MTNNGSKRKPSNEELIELVRNKTIELGRPPRKKEFPFGSVINYRYGSWKKFLKIAGLEPWGIEALMELVSDEQLIELVQKQAEEHGKIPLKKDFLYGDLARRRFGTWKNFLAKAGLETKRRRKISNKELIERIQKQAEELGRVPKGEEFPHRSAAAARYGSWYSFLVSAGLTSQISKPEISDEHLIELIKQQARELGQTPTMREFKYSKLAKSRHGTWKNFLNKAGLEPRVKRTIYGPSNEVLLELVKTKAEELGRPPRRSELNYGQLASSRFGGWNKVLLEAGLIQAQLEPVEEPSDKELLKLVKRQASELGRNPQKREFKYSKLAVDRHGSWRTFLIKAGLESEDTESFRSWLGRNLSW